MIRVPVRDVQHDHVRTRFQQGCGTRHLTGPDADRAADAQPSVLIERGVGVLLHLHQVLRCDQSSQPACLIEDGQLLQPVLVQYAAGLVARHVRPNMNDLFDGCHHLAHMHGSSRREQHIAVGHEALEAAFRPEHNQPAHLAALHQLGRLRDGCIWLDGIGMGDDEALRPLHVRDLLRLLVGGHETVNDADTTGACHCNRHRGLGHRVHVCADDRRAETDARRQAARGVDVAARGDRGAPGRQQNIVKRKRFLRADAHESLPVIGYLL